MPIERRDNRFIQCSQVHAHILPRRSRFQIVSVSTKLPAGEFVMACLDERKAELKVVKLDRAEVIRVLDRCIPAWIEARKRTKAPPVAQAPTPARGSTIVSRGKSARNARPARDPRCNGQDPSRRARGPCSDVRELRGPLEEVRPRVRPTLLDLDERCTV